MKQVKSNLSALGMCTDIFFDGSDNGSPPITELESSVAKIRLGVRLIVFYPPIAECTER